MKNFEKADIISNVAFRKDKSRFLSVEEQSRLNRLMKDKLMRFLGELHKESCRPHAMKLVDGMMNEMHGQRVKDLYKYRKEGNHVVALLCNALPPELIYAIDKCQPVTVCMGGGEVEQYASGITQGMCSITRSMTGFLVTGMCVFFNVADYVIASDVCRCIKKTAENMEKSTADVDIFTTHMKEEGHSSISTDMTSINQWIEHMGSGQGVNKERFLKYAHLYSSLRQVFKRIFALRKAPNPPINGKNALWAQQLFLVEEPKKLLNAMEKLENELKINLNKGIGYNPKGKKKRVMLIAPRIMPPFTDIYRLVENNNALIVCEESCMGITNVDYDYEQLKKLLQENNQSYKSAIQYITQSVNVNSCACFHNHDSHELKRKIKEYNVDAVILYAFKNCCVMEIKNNQIAETLDNDNIPYMKIKTDYMELYDQEEKLMKQIEKFLLF